MKADRLYFILNNESELKNLRRRKGKSREKILGPQKTEDGTGKKRRKKQLYK